jgi:LacI family transcriptional regulator
VPTIGDVARRAGVSLGTVSRVINDKQNVNPATRQKVELAIEELNYIPSHAARSLRSKQTNVIALLVPDITNPFWTTVAQASKTRRKAAATPSSSAIQTKTLPNNLAISTW